MRRDERGVALLVTILVVTLLTIVVIEFTYSTEVEAHLTRHALGAVQAGYLARAGVALGEITLREDTKDKSKPGAPSRFDALGDLWAQPFEPREVGEAVGRAGFTISDESARFNVNALAAAPGANPAKLEARKTVFQGILAALGLDLNLIFPLLDWLDADDEVTGQSGAERDDYKDLSPPVAPRNSRLLSLEELSLVKGFGDLSPQQWAGLREMLTVLPNDTLSINVNTASEPLLTAVFTAVEDAAIAKIILTQRQDQPFISVDGDLKTRISGWMSVPSQIQQMFGVQSQTFTIHGVGIAGDVSRGLAATESRQGARLSVLEWREEPAGLTLTSQGAGGINPILP